MTGEGFNHPQHEISDQGVNGPEVKSKPKKKIESSKDTIADRGKDLWGKMLGERKDGEMSAGQVEDDDPVLEILRLDEETSVRQASAEATPSSQEAVPRSASLNREQLLEASSRVRFGETNLRRVYDAQLVDEAGLRRLMHEAETGHDLRRALAREFLVKELRFERDPRLKGSMPDNGGPAGGGTTSADGQTPELSVQSASPQPSPMDPTTPPASSSRSTQPRGRQTNVSPATLIALTVFTVALALYAIWLTITR
jgi:hypothetical protein